MTAAEFANHLKQMCSTYYGTAGSAFMQGLVEALADYPERNIESLRATLEQYARELTPEKLPSRAGQSIQALRRAADCGRISH